MKEQILKWMNVKVSEEISCFISTYRERIKEDYNIQLTKDKVLQAIVHNGMRNIDMELLKEEPLFLIQESTNDKD